MGVVTKALFAQRDFTDMTILEEFQESLEVSVRSQLTESGLYMGAYFFLAPRESGMVGLWNGR